MQVTNYTDISHFFVVGLNYKKTDVDSRGKYAINNDGYKNILSLAHKYHADNLFVLSTCNRTEMYGFAPQADNLINLLCSQTVGDAATFSRSAYVKNGQQAVDHLFNVGAGLDSQILGDYEIISQLKQAVKFSKDHGMLACFTERLFNQVLQASKAIKNETALSGGTVSVSFAAVQYIKRNFATTSDTSVLLIGTGKIGRNTCKNLVDYLGTQNITLINRTEEKAAQLATELKLNYASISDLDTYVQKADIILVASNADEPVVLASQLKNTTKKLIIDLSVPFNVENSVADIPGVTLVNVDVLSKLNDETLNKRKSEIPKAKAIINKYQGEFMSWHQMHKNAHVLNAIKTRLGEIHAGLQSHNESCPHARQKLEQKIQKVVNTVASKMRVQNERGCQYIEAINEFMKAE